MKFKRLITLLLVGILFFNIDIPAQAAKVPTVKAKAEKSDAKSVKVGKSRVRVNGTKDSTTHYVVFKAPANDTYVITFSNLSVYKGEPDEYTKGVFYLYSSDDELLDCTPNFMYSPIYPYTSSYTFRLTLDKNDRVYIQSDVVYPDVTYDLDIQRPLAKKIPEYDLDASQNVPVELGKGYLFVSNSRDFYKNSLEFKAPEAGTYKFKFYNIKTSAAGRFCECVIRIDDDNDLKGKDDSFTVKRKLKKGEKVYFSLEPILHFQVSHRITLKITKVK